MFRLQGYKNHSIFILELSDDLYHISHVLFAFIVFPNERLAITGQDTSIFLFFCVETLFSFDMLSLRTSLFVYFMFRTLPQRSKIMSKVTSQIRSNAFILTNVVSDVKKYFIINDICECHTKYTQVPESIQAMNVNYVYRDYSALESYSRHVMSKTHSFTRSLLKVYAKYFTLRVSYEHCGSIGRDCQNPKLKKICKQPLNKFLNN